MGTNGNRVYRHKGRYYVYFNHWDSYPHGLGLEVLHKIPRNVSREEFEEWVRNTREYVYAQRDSQVLNNPDDPTSYVSDEHPYNDFSIEWIYEIDLDNLVFHVDNQPLFRLDNMPPDDIFMKSISFDHFGHRALHEHTPAQYRYDWRAPPPSPLPESLAAYNSCHIRSSTSSVHDLLDVPVALSSIERVRTAFVQLLVTMWMAELNVGHEVRVLENVPDRDHIPQSMLQLAFSLVNFAVGPPIPSLPYIPCGNTCDFIWIRKDVCSRITTHLDDEDNLRASIGDLVHHISTTLDKVDTIYGIACSVFHCAIVRVDKDELGTTSFAHTPALQFLPSFYARTMFTPGIEALSRLGSQASRVELLDAISDANNLPRFTHEDLLVTDSVAAKVPVEVWTRIGDFITSPADLVTLACISPRAMSAAADLTRFPLIEEFRLVDVVASGSVLPIPETTENTTEEDIRFHFLELGRAQFIAVRDGRRTKVELGQDFDDSKIFAGRRKIPFEAQTYLIADPAVIADDYAFNNLYILDLDDDNRDTS
jgi:hypothetical protein